MNCITITINFFDQGDQIKINDVINEEFFFVLFDNGDASTERHIIFDNSKIMIKINFQLNENDVKELYDLVYQIIKKSNSYSLENYSNNILQFKFNDSLFFIPKTSSVVDRLISILKIDTILEFSLNL